MKRSVRLTLAKETLAELTAEDLGGVAAGTATEALTCYTCSCRSCVECLLGPTLPDNACVPEITFRTACRIPPH